jgi:hypothetical protein
LGGAPYVGLNTWPLVIGDQVLLTPLGCQSPGHGLVEQRPPVFGDPSDGCPRVLAGLVRLSHERERTFRNPGLLRSGRKQDLERRELRKADPRIQASSDQRRRERHEIRCQEAERKEGGIDAVKLAEYLEFSGADPTAGGTPHLVQVGSKACIEDIALFEMQLAAPDILGLPRAKQSARVAFHMLEADIRQIRFPSWIYQFTDA